MSGPSALTLTAHVVLDPLPADWRDQLAARLGSRPRRIGPWAELALLGALRCLDAAGERRLPPGAILRVVGVGGPLEATRSVAQQAQQGLPLPFSFMQSQPSQMLAALGPPLGWHGDARVVWCRDTHASHQLAQLEAGPGGLLMGAIDEGRRTEWWRYDWR